MDLCKWEDFTLVTTESQTSLKVINNSPLRTLLTIFLSSGLGKPVEQLPYGVGFAGCMKNLTVVQGSK